MAVITMHKYQGLGNDYLVFDPNQNKITLLERKIRLLCQRNFGVGADGILYGPLLDEGKIGVSIFNPDGSEASGSGNGVRIFARYLKDFGYVSEKKIVITEKSKDVEVEFLDDDGRCMKVDMGKADFMRSVLSDGCSREMFNEPLMFHGNFYKVWSPCRITLYVL